MLKNRIIYLLFFVSTFSNSFSQKREKEAHYYYFSIGTCVYTNAPGTFKQKTFVTAEFGGSFGIFDIGMMLGRLNLLHSDTSWFTEILPTINVFSKGRFSEALTLGAGYVFGAKQNFLTEITNSINFAPNNRLVITVFQGNYFFDGKLSTSKAQFMGLSFTFNFIKDNSKTEQLRKKSLLN
jgi:hypothetical protein